MSRRSCGVEDTWRSALPTELAYWGEVIRTGGLQWPEDWRARLDPTTPLQDSFRELLKDAGPIVRILDVGAGPATTIGKVWPGRSVLITALDPLAEEYAALLAAQGIDVPVPTRPWRGEKLGLFADHARPFDLAHARNSLDHCYDPAAVIDGMLASVRPGGAVYLMHAIREATKQRREGLHQWDLYPVSDTSFAVDGENCHCHHILGAESVTAHGEWFSAVMRKR